MKKKKRGASTPLRGDSRPVETGAGSQRTYPTLLDALGLPHLRGLVRSAAVASALGASLGACAEPVCRGDSLDELSIHADHALDRAIDLDVGAVVDQLAVATGITPHSHAPMVAGAMPIVSPPPPVVVPGSASDLGPHLPDPSEDGEPEDPTTL